MKKTFLFFVLVSFSILIKAQTNDLPPEYLQDSFPSVILKAKEVLSHAYMAQKILTVTDTLQGWEGFPVKLYEYQTSIDLYTHQPKIGKVYMLNPPPRKISDVGRRCLLGS